MSRNDASENDQFPGMDQRCLQADVLTPLHLGLNGLEKKKKKSIHLTDCLLDLI